jgi:hypothetical protein
VALHQENDIPEHSVSSTLELSLYISCRNYLLMYNSSVNVFDGFPSLLTQITVITRNNTSLGEMFACFRMHKEKEMNR